MIKNNGVRERKNGIDGIDIGAIMGVNKNKTIHQVYLDKVNYIEKTKIDMEVEKNSNSEAVYWNLTLKEVISQEFSLRSSKKVRKENKQLVDEEHDYMVADVDRRIVGENTILMCKPENAFIIREWNGGDLPARYILEAQHCMRISKTDKCYIAAIIGCKKFAYKKVIRDEKVIDMIVQIEKDFWVNNILNRIPPKA